MTAMTIAEVASSVIAEPEDLTPGELRHLRSLEGRIERGLRTFREVGAALLEIRNKRLFRMTHATFESYCTERWNMQRARAYQLMGAAEVANLLGDGDSTIVNEVQARELVPLYHSDPKLVPKVVQAVRESGVPVTAPAIRKAVQTITGQTEPSPPSLTERLVSRLGYAATEYVEWQKTRPSRAEKAKVKDAFDRLCSIASP